MRRLVGDAPAGRTSDADADRQAGCFDAVGRKTRVIGLADACRRHSGNRDAHGGLRRGFSRNIVDLERTAAQVERHLAVACLAAARANLFERGLDVASDPVLGVKLEAEEATHRDHDRSGQAHQYLYH